MERVYKKLELVGISEKSFEDAVKNAIEKAAKTVHGLAWFEVTEQHGKITDGKITEFQAVIKAAFKVD
ncbi:MAG: dodecin domain-containing protein [Deltaproteobacteria bacterium]|nr:dodecin domain-containing protein [Deltaproteobacteria bacterium]